MTKEEAYEKLELPVGADLQVVRQKFQQMHNEFQVQIDGAFREDMRQKLQGRLMELEEAYKLLIGSEKADDSGSLPHTEKTFEQNRTEEPKTQATPLTLQQALALFGLTEHQDVAQIEEHVASYIANLQEHLSAAPLQAAKDAYQMEIDKAASANVLVNDWLQKREVERKRLESEEQQQLEAEQAEIHQPVRSGNRYGRLIGIALVLLALVMGGYYFINNSGSPSEPTTGTADPKQDSLEWEAALIGNNEQMYQHYLNKYPEGFFVLVAKDSLARMSERANAQTNEGILKTEATHKLAEQERIEQLEREKKEQAVTKRKETHIAENEANIPGQSKQTMGDINSSGHRDHTAYFSNHDGFSGFIKFRTIYKNVFGAIIQVGAIKLVITGYNTTEANIQKIKSHGIPLEISGANFTPNKFHVSIQGKASIKSSDLSKTFYSNTLMLQLSSLAGDFTHVEFKESEKIEQEIKQFDNRYEVDLWEKTGDFNNIEITEIYLSEIKDKINGILN